MAGMHELKRSASTTSLDVMNAIEGNYPRREISSSGNLQHGMPPDHVTLLSLYPGDRPPAFLAAVRRGFDAEFKSRSEDAKAKKSIRDACLYLAEASRDNKYQLKKGKFDVTIIRLTEKLNKLHDNADITDLLYDQIADVIGVAYYAVEDGYLKEDTREALKAAHKRFEGANAQPYT